MPTMRYGCVCGKTIAGERGEGIGTALRDAGWMPGRLRPFVCSQACFDARDPDRELDLHDAPIRAAEAEHAAKLRAAQLAQALAGEWRAYAVALLQAGNDPEDAAEMASSMVEARKRRFADE